MNDVLGGDLIIQISASGINVTSRAADKLPLATTAFVRQRCEIYSLHNLSSTDWTKLASADQIYARVTARVSSLFGRVLSRD